LRRRSRRSEWPLDLLRRTIVVKHARVGSIVLGTAVLLLLVAPGAGPGADVAEKRLIDNERVMVAEYVFPAGFRGDEHEAPVDEFAYVLEGEFAVITKGKGKSRVTAGQVEWAPNGAVHYSVNETTKPARVLVVLLKEK
jgi:quercetin dioxygenase-like cupin family protein